MADVTISGLSPVTPDKNTAVIPFSDGSSTYKTTPAGIVAASPGSVIQVKYFYSISTAGYNSNTWVTCPDLNAVITLTKSTNKVLIQTTASIGAYNNNDTYTKIQRGGVDISPLGGTGAVRGSGFSSPGYSGGPVCIVSNYLDTPGTVGPHTYTIQGYVQTDTTTSAYLNWNRTSTVTGSDSGSASSSIILTEIAG